MNERKVIIITREWINKIRLLSNWKRMMRNEIDKREREREKKKKRMNKQIKSNSLTNQWIMN